MATTGVILDGAQALRPLGTYTISFTASDNLATQNCGSQLVRLNTSAACCIQLEGLPATSATGMRMSADQTEYFRVLLTATGNPIHVTGYGTATGVLYITEC